MLRPVLPAYLTLLAELRRGGPQSSRTIVPVVDNTPERLCKLHGLGYVTVYAHRGGRIYTLSTLGQEVLDSGFVEYNHYRPPVFRKPPPAAVAHDGCQHHWLVGPPPLQVHKCQTCGARKEQPFVRGGSYASW